MSPICPQGTLSSLTLVPFWLSLVISNLLLNLFCFIHDQELKGLIIPNVNDKNPLDVYLLGPWIKFWQVSNITLPLCILINVSN